MALGVYVDGPSFVDAVAGAIVPVLAVPARMAANLRARPALSLSFSSGVIVRFFGAVVGAVSPICPTNG